MFELLQRRFERFKVQFHISIHLEANKPFEAFNCEICFCHDTVDYH